MLLLLEIKKLDNQRVVCVGIQQAFYESPPHSVRTSFAQTVILHLFTQLTQLQQVFKRRKAALC